MDVCFVLQLEVNQGRKSEMLFLDDEEKSARFFLAASAAYAGVSAAIKDHAHDKAVAEAVLYYHGKAREALLRSPEVEVAQERISAALERLLAMADRFANEIKDLGTRVA
jgi:hypothetical protein